MQPVLFAEPVVTHVVAVVARQHDHGVVGAAESVEFGEKTTQVSIDLENQPEVCRIHGASDVVVGKRSAHPQISERLEHRMIVLEFGVGTVRGRQVERIDKVVKRLRHDIGPMRLDEGQVDTPRVIASSPNRVDRLVGHERRLRQFVGHDRRILRRSKEPPRHATPVLVEHRVGCGVPRVRPAEAVLSEEAVVREFRPVSDAWHQAVVSQGRLETALSEVHGLGRVGIQSEGGQPVAVRSHMRFADQHRSDALAPEVIAKCALPDRQRNPVVAGAMRLDVAAGVEAHA